MKNQVTDELNFPLAYFLTFTCYGTWLHGDAIMSVNVSHNKIGMPYLPANGLQEKSAGNRMRELPYFLGASQRKIILQTIREVCDYRHWSLLAAHIRTNHAHVVMHALASPESILNSFKTYCSRKLNQSNVEPFRNRRWTRHGSTRYLWKEEQVETCIRYVVYEQGEAMAVYENKERLLVFPEQL
jgi:REP element-mobilizing transposase RayT